jgi:signal transduction histidine kinase
VNRSRILLVDDNPVLQDNLKEILEGAGYEVRTAGSCASAIAAATGSFDVALVDLRLPDGDGTSLSIQLKEISPDAEVVLLTGFATVESAADAVRAGACAYLVKPCATPELLLTLEQAMRQVRLHKEKRDLSHRAQVAEKLAAVGRLTAGLSHEIRNPLNAAGIQLAVLERRVQRLPPGVAAPLLNPLALVRDEIRRLEHILQDFLQFARPRDLNPVPVDIARILGRVADLLSADAERRGVRILRELGESPLARGDEEQLQQVAMNLALNALDAAPAGGLVRLAVSSGRGGAVQVAVEDNGPGVPAEVRGRVFEPFFTTKPAGSGLGLSIVHAIVTRHGGSVVVEDAKGGGARFVLTLPRADG